MKNVVGKSDANSLGRRLCIDTYSFIYPFRKNGIEAGVNDEETKVVILGTGGTIAGKAGSNTEMTGYQAGEIGIQTLINAVPEMLEVADVTGEQFCNIGSFDMIDDIWLRLSRRVSELLQQPEVDGYCYYTWYQTTLW